MICNVTVDTCVCGNVPEHPLSKNNTSSQTLGMLLSLFLVCHL